MAPNSDFESQSFNHFSVNEDLQLNELDPDVNCYLDQICSLDTKFYVTDEVRDQLKSLQLNSFSVFYLNIRSMKKHFEAFQNFSESINFKFRAICLSKTSLQAHEISDSNFQLPGEKGPVFLCKKLIHTNSGRISRQIPKHSNVCVSKLETKIRKILC